MFTSVTLICLAFMYLQYIYFDFTNDGEILITMLTFKSAAIMYGLQVFVKDYL